MTSFKDLTYCVVVCISSLCLVYITWPHKCFDCRIILSYDVASGSEIMPCNKIDKLLVVYRFSGNITTSITTLPT